MMYIPYGKQNITSEDIDRVKNVLEGSMITQGEEVPRFEEEVASKVGGKYGIAVNSATSALHLACKALGVSHGDHVWTSSISFVASANCAIYCGAKVDFIEIEKDTALIDAIKLEEKLEIAKSKGKLPKVVIPVHLAGSSCDMKKIHKLSEEYGFKIIEDASHAIGGKYKNEYVGNCRYSEITVFSFHPVKIITSGEGGMAITNNKRIEVSMKKLRSHGITKNIEEYQHEEKGPWYYEQQELGYNYRMNDIQAALGRSQLKRLDKIVETRNQKLKYYEQQLKTRENIRLLKVCGENLSAVHLAVTVIENKTRKQHKKIFEYLRRHNIGVQVHYTPIHLQPFYRKKGYGEGYLPVAEAYAESAISIPLYPELSQEEQDYVIKVLCEAMKYA